MSDFWILEPLNHMWFLSLGLFVAALILLSIVLHKRSEKTRRAVLATLMLLTLGVFIAYKIFLSQDAEYSAIAEAAGVGAFNWWGELPLQLCNINMILVPVACILNNRKIMCFSFFLGPLGAMLALLMPCAGFECYSILLPRMLGYYITHYMVVCGSIALASFGLFKPKYKDMLLVLVVTVTITLVIFLIDMTMRWTGVNVHANYFYVVETEGNAILDIFHSWIPVPFLYILPAFLVLVPYVLLIASGFRLGDKLSKKKHAKE